ncbi:MAG: hypothetical protein AB7P14_04200 [Blastocatellales bacterium]
MTAILICLIGFLLSFLAGRRSLVWGLAATFAMGYFYGILRANLDQSAAHFTFDAAVLGLYCAQWRQLMNLPERIKALKLQRWVAVLILWPVLLFFVPIQDPLVELVGLRGHIFLLPFLLIGARLSSEELYELALWLAALNLVAFGFALAEFFMGVPRFFPFRPGVTTIIYMSSDVAGYTAFRIPATFTSAHAYAGATVTTIPFLMGAWVQKRKQVWHGYLIALALASSILGVFMAAARTHAIILFVLLAVVTVSGGMKILKQAGWALMLAGVFWVVSNDARLQRFTSLSDTEYVVTRVQGSVNLNFASLALRYPMGNGLGGGGTSIPYFLQDLVRGGTGGLESEYSRIMLEQGMPGLCLWAGFLLWAFLRYPNSRPSDWMLGRRLAYFAGLGYFLTGLTGVGTLTAIPQTCLMLMLTGWICVPPQPSVATQLPDAGRTATNYPFVNFRPKHQQPELSISR